MENSQRIRSTSSSDASSELKENPTPESSEMESMSTEWTNEKHSLYLKSMEASFVNQLHNSLDLLNCHLQNEQSPTSSRKMGQPTCSPSGQYKVLRFGLWQKINFRRPSFQRNNVVRSRCVPASPWIKHFRSLPKLQGGELISLKDKGRISCALAADIEQPSHCCSHLKIEVSDQNFVEGDEGEENPTDGAKRMKSVEGGASSTDQVVPVGRPPSNEDEPKACTSPGG